MKKIVLTVSVLAVIALTVLNLAYSSELQPDVVYPMTNQHITWRYAGK